MGEALVSPLGHAVVVIEESEDQAFAGALGRVGRWSDRRLRTAGDGCQTLRFRQQVLLTLQEVAAGIQLGGCGVPTQDSQEGLFDERIIFGVRGRQLASYRSSLGRQQRA